MKLLHKAELKLNKTKKRNIMNTIFELNFVYYIYVLCKNNINVSIKSQFANK